MIATWVGITQSRSGSRQTSIQLYGSQETSATILDMEQRVRSVVKEPDEIAAPFVFAYIFVMVVWLLAVIAWVFWFRGYA